MTSTVVRERPILMHAESVRSILAGVKTQTRRVIRPQPSAKNNDGVNLLLARIFLDCPYGQPGDRLWVRETWYCDHAGVPERGRLPSEPPEGAIELLYYRARDLAPGGGTYTGFSGETMDNPWRPSIHMPRWASRLTLEVTAVRIERVQDISEADILAEGVTVEGAAKRLGIPWSNMPTLHDAWRHCWDALNAKRGFGWAVNPWVWVVTFRKFDA